MANKPTAAKPTKTTRKPKAKATNPRGPSAAQRASLPAAIQQIASHNGMNMPDLYDAMADQFQAKYPKNTQVFIVNMLGIRASSTAGSAAAFENWANAARRALK